MACLDCAAGTGSPAGATSDAQCVMCNAGQYSTAGSGCTGCDAGKFSVLIENEIAYPLGIQQSYPTTQLSSWCQVCFDKPYSEEIEHSNIESCKTSAGSGGWVAMASKESSGAPSFALIAFMKTSDLLFQAESGFPPGVFQLSGPAAQSSQPHCK